MLNLIYFNIFSFKFIVSVYKIYFTVCNSMSHECQMEVRMAYGSNFEISWALKL